jgi:hypothetical protein
VATDPDGSIPVEAGADGSGLDAAVADAAVPDALEPDAAPAPDYCATVPPLAAPPVIDGILDPGLALRSWLPVGIAGQPPEGGEGATYAVAWRPDGLYMFVKVTDATRLPSPSPSDLYCGDGVEFYVDSDGTYATPRQYDVTGTRQLIAAAPSDATTPARSGAVYRQTQALGPWTSTTFGGFPQSDGYSIEAFIQAADLGLASWTLAAGLRVGLDLGHNYSWDTARPPASCGGRRGQYFLRLDPAEPVMNEPFRNSRAFCTPVLAAP